MKVNQICTSHHRPGRMSFLGTDNSICCWEQSCQCTQYLSHVPAPSWWWRVGSNLPGVRGGDYISLVNQNICLCGYGLWWVQSSLRATISLLFWLALNLPLNLFLCIHFTTLKLLIAASTFAGLSVQTVQLEYNVPKFQQHESNPHFNFPEMPCLSFLSS